MAIQGIAQTSGPVVGAQTSTTNDLDSMDFMNLLIAQIQHQDPLSPMDNQQFISQLTQFTSLQQMQDMNSALQDNLSLTQSLNNTMMLDLIGKQVTVEGDGVAIQDGQISSNRLQAGQAGLATVTVRDASNVVVAHYTVPLEAGWNDLSWDGHLDKGGSAADGSYSLEVSAQDSSGSEMSSLLFMTGAVQSISFANNLAIVEVAGRQYYVSEILEIRP
jgi:flagellar basal-body rod modification protein FlgD